MPCLKPGQGQPPIGMLRKGEAGDTRRLGERFADIFR